MKRFVWKWHDAAWDGYEYTGVNLGPGRFLGFVRLVEKSPSAHEPDRDEMRRILRRLREREV